MREVFVIKYGAMNRKTLLGLVIVFTLSACSLDDVVALLVTPTPPPTVVPTETGTPTVFQTPTNTRTITPVPTFTSTPTLVGKITPTKVNVVGTQDDDALPTLYVVPTITSAPKTSFGDPGSLISSVSISTNVLIWGYCDEANYVDFDAKILSTKKNKYVLLFMRLVDKAGNQSTVWGGGAIMKQDKKSGYYTYRVRPENIAFYDEFENAWVEYQVIVATTGLKSLGRSPVYQQELTLMKCQASETDE